MAKRKKTASQRPVPSGKEQFIGEKLGFIVGFTCFLLSIFVALAFVSFLTTAGSVDQSIIDHSRAGDMANTTHELTNICGSLGSHVADFLIRQCFGLAAFVIPAFLIASAISLMRIYTISLLKWFLVMAVAMEWLSVLLAQTLAPLFGSMFYNPGGEHGAYVCQVAENVIGTPGLFVALAVVAVGFLTYVSMETVYLIRKALNPRLVFDRVKFTVSSHSESAENAEGPAVVESPEASESPENFAVEDSSENTEKSETAPSQPSAEESDLSAPPAPSDLELAIDETPAEDKADSDTMVAAEELDEMAPYDPKRDLENYHYPTLDLLKKYDTDDKPYIDMAEQNRNKDRIVEVLRNFGVEISSIKATVGPTITLYEITPAQGVRISKIRNLEDDIALSLSALGIRIIAPIPGKGTIGIEVPNAKPNIVSMESILNSRKFQESTMELPCAMGKTITNEVFMFDLAKIPHLLVAGATGQGKSVGLNAIITSLLYKKHPAELKIVLIDPKKVEFSVYDSIANHFLAKVPDEDAEPIITDVTKVVRTLNSLCKEMDTRYDLLKQAGTRNIKEYNKKFIARKLNPLGGHRYMPYIVVVIDEFGDLIMTAGKEIELPIARIAQLARAVGIHMVIATQRPTTTIITGNIKANFPGRIAFKVSAMIDSKTILDRPGANQLIGRGDMLFLGGGDPVRVQCAFVDTPEVERINEYIAGQQGYLTPFELPEPDMDGDGDGPLDVDMNSLDPLFEDAARITVLGQSGSTSMIQRKFSIGYNRAGRLMDQLEKAGVVGPASGGKPREVLIQDEMSLNNLLQNMRN